MSRATAAKVRWVLGLLLKDRSNEFSILDFSQIEPEWQTVICIAQQLWAEQIGLTKGKA